MQKKLTDAFICWSSTAMKIVEQEKPPASFIKAFVIKSGGRGKSKAALFIIVWAAAIEQTVCSRCRHST
jgi:hypothetical protein